VTPQARLCDAAGERQRQVGPLNAFFLRLLEVRPAQALVAHMARAIDRQHGRLSVGELSRTYGYAVRTVDRLFQQVIGLSPTFYSRVRTLPHLLEIEVRRCGGVLVHLVIYSLGMSGSSRHEA
jgi:methylphosphotriester-DNA--protein-cysteine methyltransferase